MRFSLPGFLKGLVITLLVGVLVIAVLRSFGIVDPFSFGGDADGPEQLVRQATESLEAVRRRQPGERRPASYDSVMAPLDKLLQQAKAVLEGETYNPVNDYEKIRSLTLPVIDIATRADAQARTETGPLAKEFRFNAQRGEASQYLANAMWERINRQLPPRSAFLNEGTPYPPAEMDALRRVLDDGIAVAPDNRDLLYIRGVVNRAEGLFAQAAADLERAVAVDHEYAAAWSTLGLVRISLREFDGAEEALEQARALSKRRAELYNQQPGAEYVSIIYNLATFHEGLASYYNRENRVAPSVESQRLMSKHAGDARRYLEEFLRLEPSGSEDARAASAKLQTLPR